MTEGTAPADHGVVANTVVERLTVPPHVGKLLAELVERLRQECGDELVAVLVYGGAVRGRYKAGRSDINLALVIRNASAQVLARIGEPLRQAWRAARVEPYIVQYDELPHIAEVFPTRILEIRAHSTLLAGRDVLTEVEVKPAAIK